MFLNRSAKTLVLFPLLFAAGCSSPDGAGSFFQPTGKNIMIESDPSGAEVYVMGEKTGETPIQLGQQQVFPNIYPKEKESLYGSVTLRKAGCADFTQRVSSRIISTGLRARLDCGGTQPAPAAVPQETPRTGETIEQRLDKIKDLLNKGLITEDEAKKARERILNEL